MTRPTKRYAAIFLLTFAACAVQGAYAQSMAQGTEQREVHAGLFASSDSEGFNTTRIGADAGIGKFDNGEYGVGARLHRFSQDGWSRTAEQLLATGKGSTKDAAVSWQAEAGLLQQHGRQLLTVDGTLHATLSPATSVEAFINRDYVETAAALDQGIHASYAGASIEQAITPHWTAVALLGLQQFSDGNERTHGRLRLIWQPSLDLGLTLQWRYRGYDSSPSDTRRAYFSPERYRESMLFAGWRKRYQGWMTTLLAGAGRQHINTDAATPTRLLEASLDAPLSKRQTLSIKAAYNRSASFGGPDYSYRQVQLAWALHY